MRIESGPNTERTVRNLLMFLMVAFFAAWFCYDGWVGYPGKNFEELLEQVPADLRDKARDAAVYPAVDTSALPAIDEAVRTSPSADETRKRLAALLGGPPSFESPDTWFYFGPALGYRIAIERGMPVRVASVKTQKSSLDIRLQRIIAVGLVGLTVFLAGFLIWIRRTRMVLDDAGLTCSGIGPIPWDAIKALDINRFQAKGIVELVYDDHGTQRRLRLNEYHHSAFDEVIDALCQRKGFENPLPLPDSPDADGESKETA